MTRSTTAPRPHSVEAHYRDLLAPVYLWMAGGRDQALKQGESDLADVTLGGGLAVDLGAGFGMHSIPLARAGWEVLALDQSSLLLRQLAELGVGLRITPVCGDLRDFTSHLDSRRPDLVLCMGDTLAHLEDHSEVKALNAAKKQSLRVAGLAAF